MGALTMKRSDIPTESQITVVTAYNKLFSAIIAVDFIDDDEKHMIDAMIREYHDDDYAQIMHYVMAWAINESNNARAQRKANAT